MKIIQIKIMIHKKSINIAYVITRAESGGAQLHVRDLILHYLSCGHQVTLLCGESGYLTDEARLAGADVIVCPEVIHPIRPAHDLTAVFKLRRRLRVLAPDIVHAHSSKAGLLARFAVLGTGIPCIFTAHGWAFSEGAPIVQRSIGWLSEWLTATITGYPIINVSEYDRQLALRYKVGRKDQHCCIPNGVPDSDYRASNFDGPVVMVARFARPKNQALLLKAWALTRASRARPLWLIGDGPDRVACMALAKELGISEQVYFPGNCSDVAKRLGDTSLFVLLSQHEGMPLSILEAMATGLPVLASKVGGIPELIEDGYNGILVEEHSTPESMALALDNCLADISTLSQMGKNSRQRYEQFFSLSAMLQRTDAMYSITLKKA